MRNKPYSPANVASPCPPMAYSINDAASAIGIGRTTLYSLIQTGRLPIVKVGKRTLVRHDDLMTLIDQGSRI